MTTTAATGQTVRFSVTKISAQWSPSKKRVAQGVGLLRSLTLLVQMKGHVGGGPGSSVFKALGARSNKPFLYVSYTPCKKFVQERLLEMPVLTSVIPPAPEWNINLRV